MASGSTPRSSLLALRLRSGQAAGRSLCRSSSSARRYGPIAIYDALERHDTQGINYLVVGPWRHGGWAGGSGESLGAIPFGSNTAEYFRNNVQAPFFAYYLKDKGTRDFPQALTFEAGANQWRRWDHWPPTKQTFSRRLYFNGDGFMTFDAQQGSLSPLAYDEFISDPAHPVPYRHRPIQSSTGTHRPS